MIRSNRVIAGAGGRGWRLALMGAWLVFLAWPGVSWALALKPGAPAEYRVQNGDTLWSIAARYLDSPWQWRELWRQNPQLGSPTQLFSGDVITLTVAAGDAPILDLQRGRGQTVKLSPAVRRAPTRDAVPSLPLDRVKVFLDAYQIVDPARLENAPTVVAGQAQRLLSGAGDTLYAHGDLPAAGSRLGVYRVGNDYHAPGGDISLGLELHRLGHASVVRDVGDVGELEVLDAVQEIRGGDLLMALDEGGIATQFLPRAPDVPLVATILAVPSGVRFIGRNDVVAIDRGRDDGVEIGHVLQVMRQGERVHDDVRDTWVTLPDTEAGAVMVFRVFDHISYALVMRASQALAVGDRLVVPADLRDAVAGGSER